MAFLVTLASGVVTFLAAFGAMTVLDELCRRLGMRWEHKLFHPICVVLLVLLLRTLAYTMAAFGGMTMFAAMCFHEVDL